MRNLWNSGLIALVEWLGFLAGAILAIAMAWSGWGVWSLVANGLISAAVRSFLFHVRCVWRPSFRFRLSTLRWAVKFGLGLQAFGILNYFNRRLDDVLIGRYVGSVGLGYYSRAYELMLYPVQNIAGVVGRVTFQHSRKLEMICPACGLVTSRRC